MSLTSLRNKTVIVSRPTVVSGYKQTFATVTAELVEVQKLSDDKAALYDGVAGKLYVVFADYDADILEHDKLVDEDGRLFRVKTGGISARTQGSIEYKRIVVEQMN